jgi:hypothetical protein
MNNGIVTGFARFVDLDGFLKEESGFGFLVDCDGHRAYLSKRVLLNSGHNPEALTPHTTLEVAVRWNRLQDRWGVVQVIALHEPEPVVEARASGQYPLSKFKDLRPALPRGWHVNRRTGKALFGVHDPDGNLRYFVVVKVGSDVVERTVRSTNINDGRAAIGKRPSRAKSASTAEQSVAPLQPETPKVARTKRAVTPKPKQPKRVLTDFAGLASALMGPANSDGSTMTH